MVISGANKVGKTTIYDAYLWAIFGVISKKNATVQPLDINNDVIHHLETSVTVVLNYNDEREIKVQRILTENWENKGTKDEKLQSTTQERLINDVPLSQKDFNKDYGKSDTSDEFDTEYLTECDLLIIDDLGTEMGNSYTASKLFYIINERLLRKKSVIISTNLSLKELQDTYSDRVFSRITSAYKCIRLFGDDIRILKATR